MLPDRVSNPGLLTYESGVIPIALRGPVVSLQLYFCQNRLVGQTRDNRDESWMI